jgi:replicative DNA helicase
MADEGSTSPAGLRAEPKNLEAEAACLGAILLDQQVFHTVTEFVRVDDFYLEKHKIIYHAITDLVNRHEPLDLVTITNHLRNQRLLDAAGGVETLNALLDVVPSSVNAEFYARIVREKSQLRGLIGTARGIIAKSLDESLEVKTIIDEAEQGILDISNREAGGAFVSVGSALQDLITQLTAMADANRKITGLSTGFPRLDEITDGFHESEFVIIAARPSIGKTALAMNIAEHMAITQKLGVAIFSMEMPGRQIMERLLSSSSMVPFSKIRKWELSSEENARVMTACDNLQAANLHIDDSTSSTVFDIRSRLRRLMAETRIDVVFLDYIQLIPHPGFRDNRQQQVAEISRALKGMAKELHIPVIVLAQLNRKIEDRKEREPMLSDLKESGSLEQDADMVIFLHREEHYLRDKTPPEKKGLAEVTVGKNRNGLLGNVVLGFDGPRFKFRHIDPVRTEGGPS